MYKGEIAGVIEKGDRGNCGERERGYEQNWEKKGKRKHRMENPAKQKSKKLLRTETERREKKNKCVEHVEHTEIFLSFIMCRKGKN